MYKYTANKWSNLLLTLGILRIGTLHDFRRMEHVRGISDPAEGTKQIWHHLDNVHVSHARQDEAREISKFGFVDFGDGPTDVLFSNVRLERNFNSPDFYVLCMSESCSRATMQCFEGADSCLQVTRPDLFFDILTGAIGEITPVCFSGVWQCVYGERTERWNRHNWGVDPALLKSPEFDGQRELRAVWRPKAPTPISPIITGDRRLGASCARINL